MVLGNGYFTTDDLINSLRSCLDYDDQWNSNIESFLNSYSETNEGYVFNIKNKKITIHKILGVPIKVEEIL